MNQVYFGLKVQDIDHKETTQSWGVFNILPLWDICSFVKVGDDLMKRELDLLFKVISNYKDAFAVDGKIGFAREVEHRIESIPEAKPFGDKARRHPQQHEQEARRQIQDMHKEGIAEPSESPWCSECVVVKKKTSDWRICADFRRLNTLAKKSSYPLPNIQSISCISHILFCQ